MRTGHGHRSLSKPIPWVWAAIALVAMAVLAFAVLVGSPANVPAAAAAPIVWTPEAANADWPGPLRGEQPGDAGLRIQVPDSVDPRGDVGAAQPWIDIAHVTLPTGNVVDFANPIGLELHGGLGSVPDPTAAWIAYGVVLDLNGDGLPDQRIGIDNGARDHREWVTDLATGQTKSNVSGGFGGFGGFETRLETWFIDRNGHVELIVKRKPGAIRFYAWASMISDGQIAATDFAPDAGWIETVNR